MPSVDERELANRRETAKFKHRGEWTLSQLTALVSR